MKVQLKQPEIIEALKGYLTSQGINIQGKDVAVEFTAGRKESGLSAEINITDITSELTSKVVVTRNLQSVTTATAIPEPEAMTEGEQSVQPGVAKATSLFA